MHRNDSERISYQTQTENTTDNNSSRHVKTKTGHPKLQKVGNLSACCMYCKSDFYAKMSDIKKHVTFQKHIEKTKPYNSATQSTLPVINKNIEAKTEEASIAMTIAEHCSMLACDHIGEACKVAFSDSIAPQNFHIHRKCTEIINGVLTLHFLKRLVYDVGDQ